jgi:hypothetical protein
MPPGFAPPDFSAPLEPAEFLRLTPPSATIRGVFFSNLLAMARAGLRGRHQSHWVRAENLDQTANAHLE